MRHGAKEFDALVAVGHGFELAQIRRVGAAADDQQTNWNIRRNTSHGLQKDVRTLVVYQSADEAYPDLAASGLLWLARPLIDERRSDSLSGDDELLGRNRVRRKRRIDPLAGCNDAFGQ